MSHNFDILMSWCRRCGRPRTEIIELDMTDCDGLPGVVHQRYRDAERHARTIFDPVVEAITGKLDAPR